MNRLLKSMIILLLITSLMVPVYADGTTTERFSETTSETSNTTTERFSESTTELPNSDTTDQGVQKEETAQTHTTDTGETSSVDQFETERDNGIPAPSSEANPTSPSSSSESSSSSQEESSIPFSDVDANKWYATDVAKATELGLINGYNGKFYPDNHLTYSEAIKLAACMHQLKTTGKVTLVNGTKNWYDTYVEYAKQNNIISKDYDWTANASRAGYVEIFAHALPEDALSAKNNVADGAIPDVKMSDYAAKEIYKLYRAGILTGSDSKGTFNPNTNILRCEVAAILTRMMDESARKTISLS